MENVPDMRIIGLIFAEFPDGAGDGRWLAGAVVAVGDDPDTAAWIALELPRDAWIPCPGSVVPSSAFAVLHRRLSALRN